MPITFERLRDMLIDLETAINCYDLLRKDIRDIMSNTSYDAETKLDFIDNVMTGSAKPPRALAQFERKYYNANKRRNERQRDKMRQQRRADNRPQRQSYPPVIQSELEAMKIDYTRYEAGNMETPEQRRDKLLILCHDRAQQIYKSRGGPFPRSALLEFAMSLNLQVEQIVEDLLDKGWLETEDGRNYTPLERTQNAEETTDAHKDSTVA